MGDKKLQTAMDRWYAKIGPNARSASASISVWYPRALPYARLEIVAHGHDEPDTLRNQELINGYVTIEGITFGGELSDLELLFGAVNEEIARMRRQADEMIAQGRIEDRAY
jgi:hypothetical protein